MSDLLLELDMGAAGETIRRSELEAALRSAVRSGRLAPASSLPSTRALASDLDISRSTVVGAYEQLVAEGYLTAEQGSRTRVAHVFTEPAGSEEVDLLGSTPKHDFRPGEPDPSSFPRRRWMRSVRNVVQDAPDSAFGYPDPRGAPELRGALAEYLARTRTVVAAPAGVRIVGGFGAALSFLGETLRHRGVTRVAIEDPSLPFHADLLRIAGLEVVPISLDTHGIEVTRLRSLQVGGVVVTPAHQYPTGVTMSADRRMELIDWARDHDAWIIEDDYDGEFRYDRRPIGSLQGLAPDRVVYSGTASKSLAPALRLAWMVVPEPLRRDLLRVMHVRAGVSSLEQLVLADFITSGELDRHVRQMRSRYRSRNTRLRDVLATSAPWLDVGGGAAGLHLMGRLSETRIDEATVLAAAAAASVGLLGLETHHRSTAAGAGLAIGFSRPAEHHFDEALAQLAEVLGRL